MKTCRLGSQAMVARVIAVSSSIIRSVTDGVREEGAVLFIPVDMFERVHFAFYRSTV